MIKQIIFLFSALFLLASCDNASKYKAEIIEIDTYQLKLDSLIGEINGIEFDSLSYMQGEAEANEKILKSLFSPDTIDMVFAEKLNMNKGIRKSLSMVEKQKNDMLNEISELKSQFSNLKEDIINGLYNNEQIEDYLNVEKLDFDNLELSYRNFDLNQKKQKRNFYYSYPQITEYVEILLNEVEKP